MRTVGSIESGGGAPQRKKAHAISFENRYGNEPAGSLLERHGLLRAAIGEMQAFDANRNFFALCIVGSFHGYRSWPADTRTAIAVLAGAPTAARTRNASVLCA